MESFEFAPLLSLFPDGVSNREALHEVDGLSCSHT